MAFDTRYASAVADAGIFFAKVVLGALVAARYAATTRRATLAESAEQAFRTQEISAFIDPAITIIIFAITALIRLSSAEATQVTCALIDHSIAVVVFSVTGLGD